MNINWLAVAAATAVGMVIACFWYGKAFLGVWRELTGVTEADSKRAGKTPMVVLLVCVTGTAIALTAACDVTSTALGHNSIWLNVGVGLVTGLGFSLSTLLQHNAFEQKPTRLTVINSAYQLVLFGGMAMTIGLLG